MYYHISERNLDDKILTPRVPVPVMDGEDDYIKRVCFAPSIIQCLHALEPNKNKLSYAETLYVHIPVDYDGEIHKPTKRAVPDVEDTGEVWFLNKVKLRCIGKIKAYERFWSCEGKTRWIWLEKYGY